jgi:hypothetical protein
MTLGLFPLADADKQIAWTPDGLNLPGEDLVEAVTIADGREGGGVSGEGDACQSPPFLQISSTQLGCKMLGIGGAAAVAANQDTSALFESFGHVVCLR